jgi:hypothetical protein
MSRAHGTPRMEFVRMSRECRSTASPAELAAGGARGRNYHPVLLSWMTRLSTHFSIGDLLMKPIVAACLLSLVASVAAAAPMTNADVNKLLDAGMPESVILEAIANGTPKFDTSADALVAMKNHGASAAVLQAMVNPKLAQAAGAGANAKGGAAAGAVLNPEEVEVVNGGQHTAMQYIVAQNRTAARALGFAGVASYATLQGDHAARRLPAKGVDFIISVPKNAQPVSYVAIASFVVRRNGTREVATGGGYMSYSSGINKDHVIPVKSEMLADQSRARDGFALYKLTPESALPSGEYAVVLYTQAARSFGLFAQAVNTNSYFDFGVD